MDEIDVRLSAELDRGGDLAPLLTFGEARAARFALHLLAQGDGPGSAAARDLVGRLDRRLEVMFPDADVLFGAEVPEPPRSPWFEPGGVSLAMALGGLEERTP